MPNEKTKIVYILPSLDKGGAERFITDLILNLNYQIFEPTLLLFVRGGQWLSELETKHIPVIVLTKKHKLDPLNFWRIYTALKKIRPTIIHTQQGGDIYGRLAAKLLRIPIIVSTEQNVNQDESLFITILKRISARWTTRIFAISEAVKQDVISRYRISGDKLTVIYNGINTNKFVNNSFPKTTAQQTLTFGTIGRLVPQKGQAVLISAWGKLKNNNINCLIAGTGPLAEELNKKIDRAGLTDRIKLIGLIDDPAAFLKSLDAFIFPSLWEGLGLVLLEAGLSGLPIIASAVDGINEIIDDETGCLVPAGDEDALSAKIDWLAANLDDPAVKNRIKNLQSKIIFQFDIKKIATDYQFWYQKLLAQHYEDPTG